MDLSEIGSLNGVYIVQYIEQNRIICKKLGTSNDAMLISAYLVDFLSVIFEGVLICQYSSWFKLPLYMNLRDLQGLELSAICGIGYM